MLLYATSDEEGFSQNGTQILTFDISLFSRNIFVNVLASFIMSFIAIVALMGHTAVIIVTFVDDYLRDQAGNFFVVYLSLTDAFTALFVMIPSAIAVACDYWPLGEAFKTILYFALVFGVCSSLSSLAAISFDRAVAVMLPFKYERIMTKHTVIVIYAIIFSLCINIAYLSATRFPFTYDYLQGIYFVDFKEELNVHLFNFMMIFMFYIPSVIVTISYSSIFIAAKKSQNALASMDDPQA